MRLFGSSSRQPLKEGTAFEFFKIILEDSIKEKKLKLPHKFVNKYGGELSGVATLIVADGVVCQVGLTKSNGSIFFDEDWHEFVEHYSIGYGNLLVFAYKGDSMFNVHIFGMSGCEIDYSSVNPVEDDFSADTGDEDDPPTLIAHRRYHSTQSKVSGGSTRALDYARAMKPKNPSFMIVMKPCDFHRKALHVPALFAREHLSWKPERMEVVAAGERKWLLSMHETRAGSMHLSVGCSKFIVDNKLKKGDVCVFELIKKDVLQVTLFARLRSKARVSSMMELGVSLFRLSVNFRNLSAEIVESS